MKTINPEQRSHMGMSPDLSVVTSPEMPPQHHEGFLVAQEETIKLGGEDIYIGKNLVHWTLEAPAELTYDGIVYFASGYGAIKQTSRALRHSLAQRGFATVTARPARTPHTGFLETVKDPQEMHAATVEHVLGKIASSSVFGRMYDRLDTSKNIIIGHSMGGFPAHIFPERDTEESTEAIINIASAGYGLPKVRHLAKDVPLGLVNALIHEVVPAAKRGHIDLGISNLIRMAHHIVKSPTQTISEGISCLRQDVFEQNQTLRDRGVKIGYLALRHDILVRADDSIALLFDDYKILENCGHLAPQKKPAVVAHEITAMLQRMDVVR